MTSKLTVATVAKALDGLFLRQTVNAHNIANGASPGFKPVRVEFEAALAQAYHHQAGRATPDLAAVNGVTPHVYVSSMKPGDAMRLDLEVANASDTAMHYEALISVLERSMQLKNLALTGGARG